MSICGQDNFANKKWAIIDIETTGIDCDQDSIIEIGFVVFNGSKIVQKFQTLIKYEGELSFFIQSLTGIDSKSLKNAPALDENLCGQINELLDGAVLLAHNADFEEKFLSKYLTDNVQYVDTIPFFALLLPDVGHLALENLIMEFAISTKEAHRGLEDSLDTLKVLLFTLYDLKQRDLKQAKSKYLQSVFKKYNFEDHFYNDLLEMSVADILEIAQTIDFDVDLKYREWRKSKESVDGSEEKVISSTSSEVSEVSLEFSGKNIEDILLDREENIAGKFPGYVYRDPQKVLALKVGQSFKNNVHAIIEAPTGIGKTLGYLLPSLLFTLSEKKQVLVATGTKTLQKQVYGNDVPRIKKILNTEKLKVAELFGSNNHLCELSFKKLDESGDLFFSQKVFEERFAYLYLNVIFEYNACNASKIDDDDNNNCGGESLKEKKYLLIDDLPYVVKTKFLVLDYLCKSIAVDFRTCIGQKCLYKSRCSYINALKKAKTADIIIGNHALMFKWPKILSLPKHIIVDEAHRIETEVTSAFTLSVSNEDLKSLHKSLLSFFGIGPLFFLLSQEKYFKLVTAATATANITDSFIDASEMISVIKKQTEKVAFDLEGYLLKLYSLIPLYFQEMPKYSELYWNELPMITSTEREKEREKEREGESKVLIYDTLLEIYQRLYEYYLLLYPSLEEFTNFDFSAISDLEAFTRFKSFMINIEDVLRAISFNLKLDNTFRKELLEKFAITTDVVNVVNVVGAEKKNEKSERNERIDSSQYVNSIKYHVEKGFVFEAAPINVGAYVYKGLLENSDSVIFTSATLTKESHVLKDFEVAEWYLGYTYLNPKKRFKSSFILPPLFDYKRDAKVFICNDVLNFYDSRFVGDTLKEVIPVVKDLGGKSLILFSSKQRFEDAREILLKSLNGSIPLFVQGMGSRVVEEYKKSKCGVLLGMESFGEGIDLPGESLQFLFVDKIPDLRMDLIIQERRKFFDRNFGDEFLNYFMFKRALGLRQKLGRLLRTSSDYGVAIVVDARVKQWKRNTIESFQQLMSPYDLQFINLRTAVAQTIQFLLRDKR
ncbi:MAG: DEAD/DEAH box helicase [Oligoflexia bacterium]|nr:DEAD/DEAH box helicase [Oligoflexia bacterium]